MLAILLTPKLIGACICLTREIAFSLSPLNFPGQAMVTQSINSLSPTGAGVITYNPREALGFGQTVIF